MYKKPMILLIIVLLLASSLGSFGHAQGNREKNVSPGFVFDHYPSYQEINRTLHEMEKNYSEIMKVFSIGKTWGWNPVTGKYDSPREIWIVKISDNVEEDENSTEPAVLITWHHAREWIGPAFNLYLMQHLLQEYNTNDTIHWIVDHYEIYIIPMANADGYVEDGNGNMSNLTGQGTGGWRKNCRDNNGNGKLDVIDKWDAEGEGVDPERNWDWHWGEGDPNPNSPTYHGPAPFSEPMTRAERDLIISKDIDSFVVIHSFSAAILLPWFYTSIPPPHKNFYYSLGKYMADRTKLDGNPARHYSYGQPYDVIGYNAPGGSSDWVYGKLNKMAIAVEMEPLYGNFYTQDGFHPPTSKIQTYCDDLYQAMIYFLEVSDSKLKPKNQSADQPDPYVVWGHVKDEMGNPLPGIRVTITNKVTGESIYTYTDENGFYMLNLATMSHAYNASTNFTISAGNFIQDFHASQDGRSHVELVVSSVPELIQPVILVVLIASVIAIKRFSRLEK